MSRYVYAHTPDPVAPEPEEPHKVPVEPPAEPPSPNPVQAPSGDAQSDDVADRQAAIAAYHAR